MSFKTIGDIASVQTGPFGSQLHKEDYVEIGTPIVTVEHLGCKKMSTQNLPRVSENDKKRLSKYCLQDGDLVFSRVGSVDRCSYIGHEEAGWLFSGRCLRVRCDKEKVCSTYVYYYFCLEETKQMVRNVAVGATMPSINTKLLSNLPFIWLPLPEQKCIAAILSALDDKIELNNRMNRNLEAQAQAIFKSWFVDFEPWGGVMPKDWREGMLGEIIFTNAESYKNSDAWSFVNYLDTGNITENVIDTVQQIDLSIDKLPSRARRKISAGDIVFSSVRPNQQHYGIIVNPLENMLVSTGFIVIGGIGRYFSYYYLTQPDNIQRLQAIAEQTVSTYPSIKASDIESMITIIPTQKVLERFCSEVSKMIELTACLQEENQRLAALRDTLLPRLMNGEIHLT